MHLFAVILKLTLVEVIVIEQRLRALRVIVAIAVTVSSQVLPVLTLFSLFLA